MTTRINRREFCRDVAGASAAGLIGINSGRVHSSPRDDRLVVHEWGTFTCLQDETGRAITGINTDDEPVPGFVHRLADLVNRPSELAPVYYKGVPRSHRDVQVRLETPVIYFYPPASASRPMTVDVRVAFRGGWLSEYYPNAAAEAPGLSEGRFDFGRITEQTVGSLQWRNLQVGGDWKLPETDAEVWLAPRRVQAAAVRNGEGEAEKYLFYRGVGNIHAPLTVARAADGGRLLVREQRRSAEENPPPLELRSLWLAHVREDGAVAFREHGGVRLFAGRAPTVAEFPAGFGEADFAVENLDRLRQSMHGALLADGLFHDEAEAMLDTWQLAYFKSPGLRLFFLLPQQWTDAVLPLEISAPAAVTRTMIGRIELVTPRQRSLLRAISRADDPQTDWFYTGLEKVKSPERHKDLWEGKARLQDLQLPVPAEYQAYVELGRFRNALILDEHARQSDAGLGRFIEAYQLSYYAAPTT